MSADLSDLPPAPGRLPLLGHTVALLRDPQRFLASVSAQGASSGSGSARTGWSWSATRP